MNKVYQRIISNVNGDCMQCAIATLLDISYEETPAFVEYKDGYFEPLFNLVKSKGFLFKGFLYNPTDKDTLIAKGRLDNLHKYKGINGFFHASVYSIKYNDGHTTHSVIIDKNYNIVHDPNPENAGVLQYPMADKLKYNGILNVLLLEQE